MNFDWISSAVVLPKPITESGGLESKCHCWLRGGVNFLLLNESFPFLASLNDPKLPQHRRYRWSESDRAWEEKRRYEKSRLTEWQTATAQSQSSFYFRKRLFFPVSSYLTIIYFQVRNSFWVGIHAWLMRVVCIL